MPPAVEVLTAPASEAFRNDPSIYEPVSKIVAKAGALGIYSGVTLIDDVASLCVVVLWDKVDDHHAMVDDPVVFPELLKYVRPMLAGPIETINLHHVAFEPPPASAVNAPFTAITHIISLQEGKTGAELEEAMRKVIHRSTHKYHSSFGKLIERDEYALISGWDDPEDHAKAVAEDQEFAGKMKELVAEHKTMYIPLRVYKRYE